MTTNATPTVADDGSPLAPDVDPSAFKEPAEPGAPVAQPDLGKMDAAMRTAEVRWVSVTGLLVLAVFYTLYFARELVFPIVVALLLDFLFSPFIRILKKARVPEPLGAALVILGVIAVLAAGVYNLAEPVKTWLQRAPATVARVQEQVRTLRRPVAQVSRAAEEVEQATREATAARGATEVVLKGPSLGERLFGTTRSIAAGAIEVILLLYFLLAAGDLFLEKLIKVLPQFGDKKKAVTIARETEASISTYLVTVTCINTCLGVVIAVAMWLLGVPDAPLWGLIAGLMEFMPYLGSTIMVLLLSIVGFATFDTLGHALLVPGTYFLINFIQGNFISPTIVGRRLTLNQVAILIGLLFWWWLWGIPGAFIAVPLLATLKIFCDHIEALAPIGEFLGR
jgi:predicted PurR-regulated permease PerM